MPGTRQPQPESSPFGFAALAVPACGILVARLLSAPAEPAPPWSSELLPAPACSVPAHCDVKAAEGAGAHVPSWPETLHDSQGYLHAPLQQSPSAQMPVRHSPCSAHGLPAAFLGRQMPAEQYSVAPHADGDEAHVPLQTVPVLSQPNVPQACVRALGILPVPLQANGKAAIPAEQVPLEAMPAGSPTG